MVLQAPVTGEGLLPGKGQGKMGVWVVCVGDRDSLFPDLVVFGYWICRRQRLIASRSCSVWLLDL